MHSKIVFTCLLFALGYTAAAETSPRQSYLRQFMGCGLTKDVSCFLDVAEDLVEEKRSEILAEADREVIKVTGRADQENSPSHLTKVINRIISELTDMFKDGVSGLFKSAREGEDEDSNEDLVEESRGKKKKKKLKGLIKLLLIGAVLKAKISLLLKAFSTALQIKFFFVAVAALLLNVARFYLDLKKGHQPQKVIYYEHAQHQHHYEGGDEEISSGPGGGYWGRSYDLEEQNKNNGGQELAYAKQKPTKAEENTYSWLG